LPIAIRVTPANKDEKSEMLKILEDFNDKNYASLYKIA
jgi:hypothetical protein